MSALVQIEQLVKRFHTASRGTVTAVDHLSLRVDAGEVYGLLGPNGAGKTTTLRMLATLVQPDAGRIRIAGVDRISDPLGARERMAYVPAEAGLPEKLTPREVVQLFAEIQGVDAPKRAAEAQLEQLGALHFGDQPCGNLSTGMKRRVVLARALVHAPEVLLLDEPTDGLDVQGRRDVLDIIRQQAAAGRAIILSSHIMGEVQRVVTRVGVVARGQMRAEGTLNDILEQAQADNLDDAFVALVAETGS